MVSMQQRVLVAGAGGFIGHHLVAFLKKRGLWVRGVDVQLPMFEPSAADEFELLDLRRWDNCLRATRGVQHVYQLAANMGGIGFIESHKAEIVHDSTLINMHMLEAARLHDVHKFMFTSSACVYPGYRQQSPSVVALREDDAYPADAEDGYGWEKLYMERACRHYREDYGLPTYMVRFHNIFGPLGTFEGGREKSPAAICRKVAMATEDDSIDVWGDGKQTRSYCYIDDCVEGLYLLMQSSYHEPINLGQDRLVSVNDLVDMVALIAGKKIRKAYDLTKPQGVRGRNSDNSRLHAVLQWEPHVSLEQGLEQTYHWIRGQLRKSRRIAA